MTQPKKKFEISLPDGRTMKRTTTCHMKAAEMALKKICPDWRAVTFRVEGEPRHDGYFQGFVNKDEPSTERYFVKEVQAL